MTSAEAQTAPKPLNKVAERILACARKCFDQHGFETPTIEDIAASAGIVRQTVYNHFSSKRDIIDQLTLRELMAVQEEIRRRTRHYPTFPEKMTEAILLSVLLARDHPYIQRTNYTAEASPQSQSSGPVLQWYREVWRPALEAARASGDLRPGLELDDVVGWLSFCQWGLQIKMDFSGMDEDELRRFIRMFMVEPLLPNRGAAEDNNLELELARLGQRLLMFKEIVSEQALRIKELESR